MRPPYSTKPSQRSVQYQPFQFSHSSSNTSCRNPQASSNSHRSTNPIAPCAPSPLSFSNKPGSSITLLFVAASAFQPVRVGALPGHPPRNHRRRRMAVVGSTDSFKPPYRRQFRAILPSSTASTCGCLPKAACCNGISRRTATNSRPAWKAKGSPTAACPSCAPPLLEDCCQPFPDRRIPPRHLRQLPPQYRGHCQTANLSADKQNSENRRQSILQDLNPLDRGADA